MTTIAWVTATGEGSLALASGAEVVPRTLLAFMQTAGPRVRVKGTAFPKTVRYAGVIGFLVDDNNPSGSLVYPTVWWRSLAFEYEDYELVEQTTPSFVATHLFWRVSYGTTLQLKPYW